jgi:hypothetical protein
MLLPPALILMHLGRVSAMTVRALVGRVHSNGGWNQRSTSELAITCCHHREIASSARPRVRGPNAPIEITTIAMAKAMKPNTAFTPPMFSR